MKAETLGTVMPDSPDAQKSSESLYDQLGGLETLERLSKAFYDRVAADPVLRSIFRKNLDVSREHQTRYLAQVLGGPKLFTRSECCLDLRTLHRGVHIESVYAHAWLDHMAAALEEIGLPASMQQTMMDYFRKEACTLEDPISRWRRKSLSELEESLESAPDLVTRTGNFGQTLLHHAAHEWEEDRIRWLLSHGAQADARDIDGGSALHSAAGRLVPAAERHSEASGGVIEALTKFGADLNAGCGSGMQAPLHMAARRGNVRITEALLSAGAEVDRQDKAGETPLRRAINCRHEPVARLLLEHGANPHSPDRKGISPIQTASSTRLAALFVQAA